MSRRLIRPADLDALSQCAPDLARVFVSLASDIALVVDDAGTVRSVAQHPDTPMAEIAPGWVGRPWVETVTDDTRRKIERLLEDAGTQGLARRREVNHLAGDGNTITMSYTAVRLGRAGPVLAVGRDLRAISAIQQRFLNTQQEIERGYWRKRQHVGRRRQLLHVATDAVFTVDVQSQHIVDSNPAAQLLWRDPGWPLAGSVAEQRFEARSRPAVRELLTQAAASGQAAEADVRLAGTHVTVRLQAVPLGNAPVQRLLLRARSADALMHDTFPLETALVRLVETTRDGVLMCDLQGRMLAANRALIRLMNIATEEQLVDRPLADWLGHADTRSLLDKVQQRGVVQGLPLRLWRADQQAMDVEAGATLLVENDQPLLGLIVRQRRAGEGAAAARDPEDFARSIASLSAALGQVSLAELVRRADRLTRQHLVQRALQLSPSNAAAAALLDVTTAQLAQLMHELAIEATSNKR